jgi:hypothetical protein
VLAVKGRAELDAFAIDRSAPLQTPRGVTSFFALSLHYARSPRNPGLAKSKRRSAPYPFVVEALAPLEPEVRPMF